MSYAQKFRAARKARGLTQLQLAVNVGTEQSYVSKIESGKLNGGKPFELIREYLEIGEIVDEKTVNKAFNKIEDDDKKEFRTEMLIVLLLVNLLTFLYLV